MADVINFSSMRNIVTEQNSFCIEIWCNVTICFTTPQPVHVHTYMFTKRLSMPRNDCMYIHMEVQIDSTVQMGLYCCVGT